LASLSLDKNKIVSLVGSNQPHRYTQDTQKEIFAVQLNKMTRPLALALVVVVAIASGHQCAVIEPENRSPLSKVFNYQGNFPPIKDDRTGEIIAGDSTTETSGANKTSDAEKMCWDLIVEQTGEHPERTERISASKSIPRSAAQF
jgi:hypothetical protein